MQGPSENHQRAVSAIVGAICMVAILGGGSFFIRFWLPPGPPNSELMFTARVIVGLVLLPTGGFAVCAAILFVASYILTAWRGRDYAKKCLEGYTSGRVMNCVVRAGCRLAVQQ
jgi:hypothetical protein